MLTPTYNRADMLPRAIESVLHQDFDDLELLIVDDGSTDNTGDVVREIQARHGRLRYLRLPRNRGVGFARDFGLRHARGEYIAWVDSDDVWLPGKLRAQVVVLEECPEIDILFGDFWNINHLKGSKRRAFVESHAAMKLLEVHQIGAELYMVDGNIETALLVDNFFQLGTVLFRATMVERIGSFNISLKLSEDLEFLWRAAIFDAQYAYLDRPLVERHKDGFSLTARSIQTRANERSRALGALRRTCRMAQRPDLLTAIRAAEHRNWRKLILAHGRARQRDKASRTFWKSLTSGFSARTWIVFSVAVLGPHAIEFFMRAQNSAICRQVLRHSRT